MLAPLKDRSILARSGEGSDRDTESTLRQALREARQTLRLAAAKGARQTVALINDIHRLNEENRQLRQRLDELENGQVIVALGQQMMSLRAENDAMIAAVRRVCHLNRRLRAAHGECKHLSTAREHALDHLELSAQHDATA
jgi:seryl-tRNA synthetase